MSLVLESQESSIQNPLDLVEQVASAHNWLYDRSSEHDLAIEMTGHWCDYRLFLSWQDEVCALLMACAYDMRVNPARQKAVGELLGRINEQLLVGHFDLWSEDGVPVFRHASLLRGMPNASVELIEDMLDVALTECERFYPAFQFVVWGGRSPKDAIEAAILETVGEA